MTSRPVLLYAPRDSGRAPCVRDTPALMSLVVCALLSLFVSTDVRGASTEEVVSGVLESVNKESHTVQIRNALDQPIFLKITKLHLLEGITPGERVTVVVNEQHEIIKLIETPVPELPAPTSR